MNADESRGAVDRKPFHPGTSLALGGVGAVLGGVAGWFLFFWIVRQGFYALALPGALLGIGAGALVRHRSIPFAVACGAGSMVLGALAEWRFRPFIQDDSLGYFVAHLHELQPMTLTFIALGGFFGFWLPFRARRRP